MFKDFSLFPMLEKFTLECFVLSGNRPSGFEKESKMWKVSRQTDRQTDAGQKKIGKANLSFQLKLTINKYVNHMTFYLRPI